jgi:rare lipoprotein A
VPSTFALVLSAALPVFVQPVGGNGPARPPQAQAAKAQPSQTIVLVGEASYYDEFHVTASGEKYDPKAFTAAVQMGLRNHFGGIKPAPNYRPAYMLAEFNGKRAVLRVNNVGTMKPGRLFDLSRAAMEYFGGVERGVITRMKVTVLPLGRDYKLGPLTGEVEEIIVTEVKPPPPVAAAAAVVETVTAPIEHLVGTLRELATPPDAPAPASAQGPVTTSGD